MCYRTVSGKGFVASFVGEDGERTRLNEALVVGEDHIVRNGVVQIIDKVSGSAADVRWAYAMG